MPETEVVSKNGSRRKQDAPSEFERTDNDGTTSSGPTEQK
jgi:hypothetical protein